MKTGKKISLPINISSAVDGIRVCFNARFKTCCLAPGGRGVAFCLPAHRSKSVNAFRFFLQIANCKAVSRRPSTTKVQLIEV